MDRGRTREATAIQFVYTPSWRQVRPGLDMSAPIGLRYTLDGQSAVSQWDGKDSGNFNIGIAGVYMGEWQFGLNYTHYIGKAVALMDFSPLLAGGTPMFGQGNHLADRHYLSFNLRRTF